MVQIHGLEIEIFDGAEEKGAKMAGHQVSAVIRQVVGKPQPQRKAVAEFGAASDVTALRDMIAAWLEQLQSDLYAPLAQQTGKMPRWFAEHDAQQMLDGKWVQIGWLNSRSHTITTQAQGRVIDWIQGAIVFYDPEQDTIYYPIFLVAEIRRRRAPRGAR